MKEREIKNPMPRNDVHTTLGSFPWDPMGSYTGRTMEPLEEPVQDSDDL